MSSEDLNITTNSVISEIKDLKSQMLLESSLKEGSIDH